MPQITPFLMFEGRASEAMSLYLSLFPDASVISMDRYGEGEPGAAGTVRHAVFSLAGQRMMCIDSPVAHGFTFTPANSLHVSFEDEADLDRVYGALSEGGAVLMPLGAYPFSPKYAWLNDRFGVSWQLSLAGP
jgi:predicted 3-demethylubiquinone-9 3-methyltransferase (glyoxalase superfamily)